MLTLSYQSMTAGLHLLNLLFDRLLALFQSHFTYVQEVTLQSLSFFLSLTFGRVSNKSIFKRFLKLLPALCKFLSNHMVLLN